MYIKPKDTINIHSNKSTTAITEDTHRLLAFDNSLQANIISIASSGKIIIVNPAACKLLGYSKKELLTKNRAAIFAINEVSFRTMLKERKAEGHSIAIVKAIKKNGILIACEITSAVFMEEDGIEKAITTINDMSQSILKQKNIDIKKDKSVADNILFAKSKQKNIDAVKEKIISNNIVLAKSRQRNIDTKKEKVVFNNIVLAKEKYNIWKKYIGKTSYDVMWDWNITTGQVYVGDSIDEVFGYKLQNNTINFRDFSRCLLPNAKDAFEKNLFEALDSGKKNWKDSFMLKRYNGSMAFTLSRGSIMRDNKGKANHLIGATQDVSRLQEMKKKLEAQSSVKGKERKKFLNKQKSLEGKLEQEMRLKENQIAEATDSAREAERSDIGKELHDNVNQLLGASRLYLNMAKLGGKDSEMFLQRSSQYTLTAIEEIRKLTKGLSTNVIKNPGIYEAIQNLSRDTMEAGHLKIHCSLNSFKEDSVSDKFKLNIYRIMQEQLNNILKHAKATKVSIKLLQNKKLIILSISDNGLGFNTVKRKNGIGLDNIKSRALTYNGATDIVSQPGQGCVLTVIFPVTDKPVEVH